MSQQMISTINSSFFMADPVPIKRNGNPVTMNTVDQSFLVKGDETKDSAFSNTSGSSFEQNSSKPSGFNNDSSSVSSYEHVNGKEDVFFISNQNGSFQLHRKTLKETLHELKSQCHVSVRQLNAEHTELFKSVVEALRLLYGSQALYDLILNDIRGIFSDVKDVRPGTVAAFFIGCFNDDKFPGPMGCSPKCAGSSLPPPEGTPGYTNCDDLVLIYSDGLFSSLNEKRSSHAYIYVGSGNFNGFSNENIRQLKEAGIENASIIFGNPDGSYREVTSPLNLDQLPKKQEADNSGSNSSNSSSNVTSSEGAASGNGSGAAIAFAVVLILIIIILLIVFFRYGK